MEPVAPTHILVVEDDALVSNLVVLNLKHEGYSVSSACNFADGLEAITTNPPALAIVDVMLPGGDGFTLTRTARDRFIRCPVMMLTVRSETAAKIRGLDCGADDYVTKPFDVPELLARVRALLRRAQGELPPIMRFDFDRYWVRFDTGRALTNDGEISLSEKELRLLQLFIMREDRVLTRTEILEQVWGMEVFPIERTVDNFVLRLRRLFEPNPDQPVHFMTARGRGYFFRR